MATGKYQKWLEPDNLILLEAWARDGLTKEQIAHNMGISRETLNVWGKKYPCISDSIKKGKEVVDVIVENALYERALGGIHEVKKNFKVKRSYYDENGRKCEKEELVTGTDEIYIPGDTTAQIFWLKNRKPEEWRDKREMESRIGVDPDNSMKALADIIMNSRPNRSLADYE